MGFFDVWMWVCSEGSGGFMVFVDGDEDEIFSAEGGFDGVSTRDVGLRTW